MTLESILVSNNSDNAAVSLVDDKDRGASREEQTTVDFKMVTFSLSEKDYAIDIMHVKEIIMTGNFTHVPNVLPFVVGVHNLRGDIIPIIDMKKFFNIRAEQRTPGQNENIIILTLDDQTFGIVVDKIDKVVGIQKSTIRPPHPLFSDVNIKYISGVVENNDRLYILLDVERIFSKNSQDSASFLTDRSERHENPYEAESDENQVSQTQSEEVNAEVSEKTPEIVKTDVQNSNKDFNFLCSSLKNYANFNVSKINENWVKLRLDAWKKEKGDNYQVQNKADAENFLKPFWSDYTGTWWSKEYAESLFVLLPANSASQIVVWNAGCGNGIETYCLACLLAKKYPSSKIRIYAHDTDLLGISNAPLTPIPDAVASGWMSAYIAKDVNNKPTFTKEIKDSVMFEYHDCLNTNALPMADIIFSRDLLSIVDENGQKTLVNDFSEKLKGNGILFVGSNEELNGPEFNEVTVGSVTVYKK